ncbi:MAG: protein kinase [Isosphaeraceae bacterium]
MRATSTTSQHPEEVRHACATLRDRLRAGEATRVEELLEIYPALAVSDEAVFELIHAEISARYELGERPTLDEWEARFPSLLSRRDVVDSLRSIFGTEMHTLADSPPPGLGVAAPSDRAQERRRLPKVANFQLIQEIGRGGMGVVYKARQTGLSRIVALKMILSGEHAGLKDRARLRNEAEAAARLLHPNVVQIYEIGEHEGLPFLAMEYVAGGTLLGMLRGMPQAFRWSARLTETLARAIHVAHRQNIIHRDLNPTNILMTPDGTPKISDFGLAKFLLEDAGVSQNGAMLGTPPYMAPEQVSGQPLGITARTDIYALGALLYEMLTGTAPFRGFTPMETVCQVMEADVVPPSRLRHGVPVDLETICLKCLEKDPARRYSTAEELADDLRRFQESQPVLARRTSRLRQAIQWSRRQPLAARLLALCSLLTIAVLSLAGGYFVTVESLRLQRVGAADQIEKGRIDNRVSDRKLEDKELHDQRLRYDLVLGQVKQAAEAGQVELAQELFGSLPEQNSPGFERSYLDRLVRAAVRRLEAHSSPVTSLATADGGGLLASGDRDGQVLAWDRVDGPPRPCRGRHEGPVDHLAAAVSRTHGAVIASTTERPDGAMDLKLWDATSGAQLQAFREERFHATGLTFSPDGGLLSVRGTTPTHPDGRCLLWRSSGKAWEPDRSNSEAPGLLQAFSPDGALIATGHPDGTVRLEGTRDRLALSLEQRPGGKVASLKFSRKGSQLAAGREDGSVTVWDLADRRVRSHRADHPGPADFVDFVDGDAGLVIRDGSRSLRLERLGDASIRRLAGGEWGVGAIARSADGTILAADCNRQRLAVWDLRSGDLLASYSTTSGPIGAFAFAPDDRSVIVTCSDSCMRDLRFRETGDRPEALAGHGAAANALAFSRGDRFLASGAADGTIKIWDGSTGRELGKLTGHDQSVTSLAFLTDDELVSAGLDGKVLRWKLRRVEGDHADIASTPGMLCPAGEPLFAVSVAPTSNPPLIAVGGSSGTIRIWDPDGSEMGRPLKGHLGPVRSIVFFASNILASASEDRRVYVWDVADPVPYLKTDPFTGSMRTVAYSEGRLLAASGDPRIVQIWELPALNEGPKLAGHPLPVRSIVFAPSGKVLATACDDGQIRLWDTETGMRLYSLKGHQGPINALAFSGDGATLASCDEAGRINLWRGDRPRSPGPQANPPR